MFLLDTNVVSEIRKARPHGAVVAWVSAQEATSLFLSAMTVAELQRGIEMTREQDEDKARQIEEWLEQLLVTGQIVAMDASVCRLWARLMHHRPDALAEDAFIAATAAVHRMVVVTRNVRDFRTFGVPTLNPFDRPRST
jgi:predicted nucleic acid-binding protein